MYVSVRKASKLRYLYLGFSETELTQFTGRSANEFKSGTLKVDVEGDALSGLTITRNNKGGKWAVGKITHLSSRSKAEIRVRPNKIGVVNVSIGQVALNGQVSEGRIKLPALPPQFHADKGEFLAVHHPKLAEVPSTPPVVDDGFVWSGMGRLRRKDVVEKEAEATAVAAAIAGEPITLATLGPALEAKAAAQAAAEEAAQPPVTMQLLDEEIERINKYVTILNEKPRRQVELQLEEGELFFRVTYRRKKAQP